MIHVVDMLFIMVDLKFPLFVYTHYKSVSLNSMAQITKKHNSWISKNNLNKILNKERLLKLEPILTKNLEQQGTVAACQCHFQHLPWTRQTGRQL